MKRMLLPVLVVFVLMVSVAQAGVSRGDDHVVQNKMRELVLDTINSNRELFPDQKAAAEKALLLFDSYDFGRPALKEAMCAVAEYQGNDHDKTNWAALVLVYMMVNSRCQSGDDIPARIALHEARLLDMANSRLREQILRDAAGLAGYYEDLVVMQSEMGLGARLANADSFARDVWSSRLPSTGVLDMLAGAGSPGLDSMVYARCVPDVKAYRLALDYVLSHGQVQKGEYAHSVYNIDRWTKMIYTDRSLEVDRNAEKITLTSGVTVPLFTIPSVPVQLREYIRSGHFRGGEDGLNAVSAMLTRVAGIPSLNVEIDDGKQRRSILLYYVQNRNVWIPCQTGNIDEKIRYHLSLKPMPDMPRKEYVVSGHTLALLLKYGLHSTEIRTIMMSGDPLMIEVICAGRHDADGDGLHDGEERLWATSANNPDSDGDGISDLAEIEAGGDPLRPDAKGVAIDGYVSDLLRRADLQSFTDPANDAVAGCPDVEKMYAVTDDRVVRLGIAGGTVRFEEAYMHEISVVCYGGREIWAFRFYRQPDSRFLKQEILLIRGGKTEVQDFNGDVIASAGRDFECTIPLYVAGKGNPAMIVYKTWSAGGDVLERAVAGNVRTTW